MKRIFALLLAVTLLLLTVACAAPDEASSPSNDPATPNGNLSDGVISSDSPLTAQSVVGRWVFRCDLSDFEATEHVEGTVTGYLLFREDGTARMYYIESELYPVLKNLLNGITTMEYIAESMGLTVEQLERALFLQASSWDAFKEKRVEDLLAALKKTDTFGLSDGAGNLVLLEGQCRIDGDRIFIDSNGPFASEEGFPFSYSLGVLTLTVKGVEYEMQKE